MDLATNNIACSSPISSTNSSASLTSSVVLPSLFTRAGSLNVASKHSPLHSVHHQHHQDLDGLIAMNDSALSQQIEFILQDAPMDQDDEDDEESEEHGQLRHHQRHHFSTNSPLCGQFEIQQQQQQHQHNPPNTTATITSGALSHVTSGSFLQHSIASGSNSNSNSSTGSNLIESSSPPEHLLNGRRIIVTSNACGTSHHHLSMNHAQSAQLNIKNDVNLQDAQMREIDEESEQAAEEEAAAAVTAEIMAQQQVKLEQFDEDDEELEFMSQNGAPSQLVQLPGSSLMNTNLPTNSASGLEAQLAHLQRRPVYISTSGGVTGATFMRMPAVISRNPGNPGTIITTQQALQQAAQQLTVLNVVQPGGQPTQLILQAAPVSTAVSTPTPTVVVSSTTGSAQTVAQNSNKDNSTSQNMAIAVTNSQSPPVSSASAQSSPSTPETATSVPAGASESSATDTISITTYQCLLCVEKFESKELFDIHRSGHANNMKCAICNMVLKSLKNYEKHCLRCKPYECQICGRVVRFRPNFIKHMRVHTGQQSERHKYKCDVCHKEFMSFEYFKVHKKIHNENVNLTCEICGKVFSALASLRGHSKLHSGVKLHKCDVCGKGFGQRYNLKIHARTHTGDFPFECKICKKKLHTQSSLQTHLAVHQREQACQLNASSNAATAATSTVTTSSTSSASNVINKQGSAAQNTKNSNDGKSNTSPQQRHQQRNHQFTLSDNDSYETKSRIVTTVRQNNSFNNTITTTAEDSSNESNGSQMGVDSQQQLLLPGTPTRTIVIKNYVHAHANDQNDLQQKQQQQPQHTQQQHTQVIHHQGGAGIVGGGASGSSQQQLQQQLLRKTPIIHSTGGATTLSSALASVVQQTGSPSASPLSSTPCSSSVVVSKTVTPQLSLSSAGMGTSTIRSTRNHMTNSHSTLQRNNHHRIPNRRRHHIGLGDDDDDDVDHLRMHNGRATNFDDDDDIDDDEKSSPSLATTAIKVEPNLYSSGSGDNSNEMLIKEEVLFEDSAAHSPHSPPSSKFRISSFENEFVDHHVDLNHSLPPYGNLFEPHSMPDSMSVHLYPDDDDDFRLDHSSLGGLHNTSSSTTDGEFIKKEWVYGAGSGYGMNGKFDEDTDALCDAANFIYN